MRKNNIPYRTTFLEKFAKSSWEHLQHIGYPSSKNEEWRFSNPNPWILSNTIDKIDQSPPNIIYSLALNSKIIISNDTGPGHVAALAKRNFIWIVNDNNISKSNTPCGKHIYIVKSRSVKDISSKEIINLIVKNKLC